MVALPGSYPKDLLLKLICFQLILVIPNQKIIVLILTQIIPTNPQCQVLICRLQGLLMAWVLRFIYFFDLKIDFKSIQCHIGTAFLWQGN